MMKVTVAITGIVIRALFEMEILKNGRYAVLAECVVVSQQQQQQQTEAPGKGSNKTTDEKRANETTTWTAVTTPCQYCDYEHLHDQYPVQYQITATISAEDKTVLKKVVDVQKQWKAVILEAMETERAKHYKQSYNMPYKKGSLKEEADVNVQVLRSQCSTRICTQTFVVLYNNVPIPAQVIVSDLSLLSLSRISARLRVPVESITASLSISKKKSQWWIVAVVIGIAFGVVAAGWLCLFVYYNTCGRPYITTAEKPLIHTIFLKDELIQTNGSATEGGQYYDFQSRAAELDAGKSSQTIPSENVVVSTMPDKLQNISQTEATSAVATSPMVINEQSMIEISQQFECPVSIITRPRRREDLRIHKLEPLSDISLPVVKEVLEEDKLHPHPISPTAFGILEVRSLTEQKHCNPMKCL